MAKDEYLEIQDLDTTPEADKVSMALIYITTLLALSAFFVLQYHLGEHYGIGLLAK